MLKILKLYMLAAQIMRLEKRQSHYLGSNRTIFVVFIFGLTLRAGHAAGIGGSIALYFLVHWTNFCHPQRTMW